MKTLGLPENRRYIYNTLHQYEDTCLPSHQTSDFPLRMSWFFPFDKVTQNGPQSSQIEKTQLKVKMIAFGNFQIRASYPHGEMQTFATRMEQVMLTSSLVMKPTSLSPVSMVTCGKTKQMTSQILLLAVSLETGSGLFHLNAFQVCLLLFFFDSLFAQNNSVSQSRFFMRTYRGRSTVNACPAPPHDFSSWLFDELAILFNERLTGDKICRYDLSVRW